MCELYTTNQLNQVLPSVSGRHQNWAKYGLAVPAVSQRRPSRKGNRHSVQDLVALAVLQHLFDNGMSAADIRKALCSKETFKDAGNDKFREDDPGRQLSNFFSAHGFEWKVVISKDFDGNAQIFTCENSEPENSKIPSRTGSVTLVEVRRIYDEIISRLNRIGCSKRLKQEDPVFSPQDG
jgi:hypothetical protein